jgi:hypothetical protein
MRARARKKRGDIIMRSGKLLLGIARNSSPARFPSYFALSRNFISCQNVISVLEKGNKHPLSVATFSRIYTTITSSPLFGSQENS